MKTLITADLHIGTFSNLKLGYDKDGKHRRLTDIESVLDQIVNLAKNCDKAYVLGDIFHNKGLISSQSFQVWSKFVNDITSHCSLGVIPGNHDLGRHDTHFLEVSSGIYVGNEAFYDNGVILVPWVSDPMESIRGLSGFDAKLVMGHFALKGAEINNGIYDNNESSVDHKELRSLFPNAKIIAGHYHIPQEVADDVHYVGSPIQVTWGEADKECRVFIYDSETGELESIPIKSPEFGKITVTSEDDIAQLDNLGSVEYLRIYYDDGVNLPTEEIDEKFRVVQYIPQSFGYETGETTSMEIISLDEAVDQYTDDEKLRKFGKGILEAVRG